MEHKREPVDRSPHPGRNESRTHPSRGALRFWRRQWRRLKYRVHPPSVRLVYDPGYEKLVSGVPLDPLRADKILAFLSTERLIRRDEISRPRPAALKNLLLVHTERYIESLQLPDVLTAILGTPVGDGELERVLDLQRLMVGGTIQATRLALATRNVAVNLGGGFHHASATHGMGFCVLNDLAVAVARLRKNDFADNVLIVDLDLHDGNGTREIFAADSTVHTFSIHNQHWGDTAAVESTAIALGAAVGDERYSGAITEALPPVLERFKPRLVVYLAGCDVAKDDPIGDWNISSEAIFARNRYVIDAARARGVPLVVVLGGGYGDGAWRHFARTLAWLAGDVEIEPPRNEELALLRFRQIRAELDPLHLTQSSASDGWELTEEDLVGILPGIPRQTRFLGYFSKVGIELILERFGILQQLRARGFKTPTVKLELEHPLGQTLRVYGDPDATELLVELRVNRSVRAVPGMEVLAVEWLLMQNPRESFSASELALPGQHHPGLHMLAEVFGWLVVLCETLELDGLFFHPSHYHIAALSRRHVRFAAPADEAFFRALQRTLGGVPLAEASIAIENGSVVEAASRRPVRWHAAPMVLPVSARLRALLTSEGYESEVTNALAALEFRLVPACETAPPASV